MEFSIRGGGSSRFWVRFHTFFFIFKHGLNHPEMQRNFFLPLGKAPRIRKPSLFTIFYAYITCMNSYQFVHTKYETEESQPRYSVYTRDSAATIKLCTIHAQLD